MKRQIIKEFSNDYGPHDHEASMARAELYKTVEMATKLFHMIEPGDNLEGWVAAKITKAADYIDSVAHYIEYQKKFEQGQSEVMPDHNENESADYVESVRQELSTSLAEQWNRQKNQGK
jgi:hypothetical protein